MEKLPTFTDISVNIHKMTSRYREVEVKADRMLQNSIHHLLFFKRAYLLSLKMFRGSVILC